MKYPLFPYLIDCRYVRFSHGIHLCNKKTFHNKYNNKILANLSKIKVYKNILLTLTRF